MPLACLNAALIAALQVMVFRCTASSAISAMRLEARCHSLPLLDVRIAALQVIVSRCAVHSTILAVRPEARCQSHVFSQH